MAEKEKGTKTSETEEIHLTVDQAAELDYGKGDDKDEA